MNCPDCDSIMYSDTCGCGFKAPKEETRIHSHKFYLPGVCEKASPEKVDAEIKKMRQGQKKYRSVLSRGESYSDYLAALTRSKMKKRDFDQTRLDKNGWSKADEESFRLTCRSVKLYLPD